MCSEKKDFIKIPAFYQAISILNCHFFVLYTYILVISRHSAIIFWYFEWMNCLLFSQVVNYPFWVPLYEQLLVCLETSSIHINYFSSIKLMIFKLLIITLSFILTSPPQSSPSYYNMMSCLILFNWFISRTYVTITTSFPIWRQPWKEITLKQCPWN